MPLGRNSNNVLFILDCEYNCSDCSDYVESLQEAVVKAVVICESYEPTALVLECFCARATELRDRWAERVGLK